MIKADAVAYVAKSIRSSLLTDSALVLAKAEQLRYQISPSKTYPCTLVVRDGMGAVVALAVTTKYAVEPVMTAVTERLWQLKVKELKDTQTGPLATRMGFSTFQIDLQQAELQTAREAQAQVCEQRARHLIQQANELRKQARSYRNE